MIPFLFEAAVRSLGLAVVTWLALALLRVRCPRRVSLVWTAVLISALSMPLLMRLAERVVAVAPSEAVAWIPSKTASVTLTPLSTATFGGRRSVFNWNTVAGAVYLIVAAGLGIRLLAGLRQVTGLRRRSLVVDMQCAPGRDVRASREITIPVTCGATILLPADFTSWSEYKRQAVLLHEQAHVDRGDYYIHLLASLHSTVFWFSPLSWWLKSRLVELAEDAADNAAVGKLGDPLSYADVLIETAVKGSRLGFVAPRMANAGTIERRVERLLGASPGSLAMPPLRRVATLGMIIPLAGLFAMVWAERAQPIRAALLQPAAIPNQVEPAAQEAPQAPTPVAPAPAAAAPTPQPRGGNEASATEQQQPPGHLGFWADQEVVDIITLEEQNAFNRLRTDEEREAFIREFWRRRDPDPNTTENEYRIEFYRRIVLANDSFGTRTGTPGWRTDRGRVLIRFGEPDEVQTQTMGRTFYRPIEEGGGVTSTFPFEIWRYRYIEAIGNNVLLEFVDHTGTGEYRLTLDPREGDAILGNSNR